MVAEPKITVLILDDDKDSREMLKFYLEKQGMTVLVAGDGEEGLKILEKEDVSIVLSDIMMPKVDGIEFLKHVRQYNLQTEVIMITGQSSVEKCIDVLEHGACQYLIKPVNLEDVLASIDRAKRNIQEKREMMRRAMQNKKE